MVIPLFPELTELIRFTRPFLNVISKAKAGTMVRALVDFYVNMNMDTGAEVIFQLSGLLRFSSSNHLPRRSISVENA